MQGKIGLACILKSDTSPQSIFRVSIHIDRLVEDLHTAIKAKKQVALANVDTSSLCVLKLKPLLAVPDDDKDFASQLYEAVSTLEEHAELCSPLKPISRYFTSSLPRESLHLIVDVLPVEYLCDRLPTAPVTPPRRTSLNPETTSLLESTPITQRLLSVTENSNDRSHDALDELLQADLAKENTSFQSPAPLSTTATASTQPKSNLPSNPSPHHAASQKSNSTSTLPTPAILVVIVVHPEVEVPSVAAI